MVIPTERLVLRRFRAEDAAAFAAYRSVPEIARFQSWDAPVSLEDAAASVQAYASGDP
jgi:aminoglycoside 6'-N-acetyltransferase